MTTVWPIIALGMVAAISLLLPAIVVRFKSKRDRSTTAVSSAFAVSADDADESSVDIERWPPMFVASTLPLVLMLLFLYAAAAQQPDIRSLWFLLVMILPVAGGALYARRKIGHDTTRRDGE